MLAHCLPGYPGVMQPDLKPCGFENRSIHILKETILRSYKAMLRQFSGKGNIIILSFKNQRLKQIET